MQRKDTGQNPNIYVRNYETSEERKANFERNRYANQAVNIQSPFNKNQHKYNLRQQQKMMENHSGMYYNARDSITRIKNNIAAKSNTNQDEFDMNMVVNPEYKKT